MSGTFTVRVDELIEQAEGRWSARCEVDQVYAHYQEAHPEFQHPDGGQAFYLRDSIYLEPHMETLAVGLIDQYGVGVQAGLQRVAENIARGVYLRAPWEFMDLRRSGHPYVTRHGGKVWERPPDVGRLSEEELRLKHKVSYLFDPNRYRRGRGR